MAGSKLRLRFIGTARNANEHEIKLAENSKTIEELDNAIFLADSNLNKLKVYILDTNIAQKFKLLLPDDYAFLNGLFVNEKYAESKHFYNF